MGKKEVIHKLEKAIQKAIGNKRKVFLHISSPKLKMSKKINPVDLDVSETAIDIHANDFDMELDCSEATVEYIDEIDCDTFEFVSGENYIALDCLN